MNRRDSLSAAAETTDRLVQVARAYYLDDQTQEQIALTLGVSRSLVSRLLRMARERGIVRVEVVDPALASMELVTVVRRCFPHLRQVVIAPTMSGSPDAVRAMVGRYGAQFLHSALEPNQHLAIGCGRTLRALVDAMSPRQTHTRVVQAMGNIGHEAQSVDYNEIAWQAAEALGGRAYYLSAPAVLGRTSADAASFIAGNPSLKVTLDLARNAQMFVVGIGSIESEQLYVRSGLIAQEELDTLHGAVGDICGRFFDIEGHELPAPFSNRMVGITLDDLKNAPLSIGVAAGSEKVSAILGALRGRFINVLVSDEQTVRSVVELAEVARQ
ncbi:sugar-binding transcriptional regulator [Anaerolineae bacterium CFX9]|nr:sugar-binding transcriptional regulator [Anaerolineae bacterium CFX9]